MKIVQIFFCINEQLNELLNKLHINGWKAVLATFSPVSLRWLHQPTKVLLCMSRCHICKVMWDNNDCYIRVYFNTDCFIRVLMTALLEYINIRLLKLIDSNLNIRNVCCSLS